MAEVRDANVIIGSFKDRQPAEQAIDELRQEGFDDRQLGFACPDERGDTEVISEPGGKTAPGESEGAGIAGGGLIGGALGAAATGVIPGVGPIVAVGALAGVLGGAAIGGAAGGFAAAMAEMGVPQQVAQTCEEELKAGRSIVTVQPANGEDATARSILQRHGADDLRGRAG